MAKNRKAMLVLSLALTGAVGARAAAENAAEVETSIPLIAAYAFGHI